ncbi:MAG: hypothetical protein K2P98_05025, partial [Neisseriaceae bacterium]|nr:hypothetical protein [Neisseriaceae bacterium]
MLTSSGQSLRMAQALQHMGMVSWIRREVLQQETLLRSEEANQVDSLSSKSNRERSVIQAEEGDGQTALAKSSIREPIEESQVRPLTPFVVADDWQGLAAQAESCLRCDLSKTRVQSVFSGQKLAITPAVGLKCLVIAESPSEHDEREGLILSDQHGQLLSNMLSAIGWGDEAQSAWSSLVKCRPQGTAMASVQQISACSPYLLAQIQLLRPKVIIT